MTLRRRLSLWYGTILVLSVLLAVVPAYDELVLDAPNYSHYEETIAHSRFRDLLQDMALVSIPPGVVGLIGGWLLVRRALRPLDKVTELAEKLDENSLGERIPPGKRDDEIERLAQVFNVMAARMDKAFQRVRDLTLHASHELKTPLAVLRAEMETALRTWEGLNEQQSTAIASQIEEVDRLSKIVDGLTFLTKADAGQLMLAKEPVALHELVADAAQDAEILAHAADISVTLGSCQEATVIGDRQRLRQVLLNLVDNAVKYNLPSGTVDISLETSSGSANILVRNTSPEIDSASQEKVFDRFYRGPQSQGNIDGSGLGLSISQWIVQEHQGRLAFHCDGGLATVALTLPLASGQ